MKIGDDDFNYYDAWDADGSETTVVAIRKDYFKWSYLDVALYDRVVQLKRDRLVLRTQLVYELMCLKRICLQHGIPLDVSRYVIVPFIIANRDLTFKSYLQSKDLKEDMGIIRQLMFDLFTAAMVSFKFIVSKVWGGA